MTSLFQLPELKGDADLQHWGNLHGAALPLAISQFLQHHQGLYVVLVPDTPTALRLEQELSAFLPSEV